MLGSTHLVEYLVASWLREHGAVKVQLMIRANNTTVLGFYDHLGYEDANVQVRSKRLSQ